MDIRYNKKNFIFDEKVNFLYSEILKFYNELKELDNGKKAIQIPKTLSFKFDDSGYKHAFIKKYEILNNEEKIELKNESEKFTNNRTHKLENYKVIYLKFNNLSKILRLVLKPFVIESKNLNDKNELTAVEYFTSDTDNCCLFTIDINIRNNKTGNKYIENLNQYKEYYENNLNTIKNNNEIFNIDLEILRKNISSFFNIKDKQIIIPVKESIKNIENLTIKAEEKNGNILEQNFLDISISQDNHKKYKLDLEKQKINIPNDVKLCSVNIKDNLENIEIFKNILNDEKFIKCTIQENTQIEENKIKQIISNINKIINQEFINKDLIDIICDNNIIKMLDLVGNNAYKYDEEKIKYLLNTYEQLNNNPEQLTTIDKILQMDEKNIPIFLMQGAPGTGKTELMFLLAREFSKKGKNTLITSPSSIACNNMVDRLKNNKELILKRFTNCTNQKNYTKEIINNQKNYLVNQVLAGYEFNDEVMDSDEKINKLESKVREYTLELEKNTDFYEQERKIYQPYFDLRNEKEKQDKLIEQKQQEKIKIEAEYGEITQKINSLELPKEELVGQFNSFKSNILEHQKEKEEVILTIQKIKDKINQLEEQKLSEEEKQKENLTILQDKNNLKEEYENKINTLLDELAFINNMDLDEELSECISCFDKNEKWPANNFRTKYPDTIDIFDKFYDCRKIIIADEIFANNDNAFSNQTITKLWNNKDNLYMADLNKDDILKHIENIYNYNNLSKIKKMSMSVFNTKCDELSKKDILNSKMIIIDYFNKIKYNYSGILKKLFQINFVPIFNELKVEKESNYQKKCNELNNIGKEIKNRNAKNEKILEKINDITKEIESKSKNSKILNGQIEETDKLLSEYMEKAQDVAYQIKNINDQLEDIEPKKQKIEAIIKEVNTEYNKLNKENKKYEEKLEQFKSNYGDELAKFLIFEKKYKLEKKSLISEIKRISNFFENLKEKINLQNSDKNSREVLNIIYDYVKELNALKNSKIEDLDKYLTGKGTIFRKAFNLDMNDEYNLLLMAKDEISQLLEENENLKFDYVIIDEANKYSFEDLIILLPITKHFILIGDYMQLNKSYLDYSNLNSDIRKIIKTEELWNKLNNQPFKILLNQLIDYNRKNKIPSFTKNPFVSVLKDQYRMNQQIYDLVSIMYTVNNFFEMNDLKKVTSNDVLCIDIKENEENKFISQLLNELQKNITQFLNIKTVGILASNPHQVEYMNSLPTSRESKLEIGIFDEFQGKEYDLIIVNMLQMSELNCIANIQKLNIAFSRAKSHLIIIGDFDKLQNMAERTIISKNDTLDNDEEKIIKMYNKLILKLCETKKEYYTDEEKLNKIINFLKENEYE